ncbi:MAG: adenylate kinase [Candidatus Aenigmarchaeota archaeon]|nr:adenylate kinase [Candidatus Aenigmarchaeota archaeon]
MKIVLFGPPGSGKGTYASRIAPIYKIPHISTGDIFRGHLAQKTELGKKIEDVMKSGNLVPDDLTMDVVKDRLSQADCKNGFILDGFPRTIPQAEMFDKMEKVDVIVNLVVPDEIIIKRLSSRLSCKECKTIFNTLTLKPKIEGKCDKCGGELFLRDDDKPEQIKNRLEVYRRQTMPLVDYYRKKGISYDVTCDRIDIPPEEIVAKILKVLESLK